MGSLEQETRYMACLRQKLNYVKTNKFKTNNLNKLKTNYSYFDTYVQPRSQGFSLFVIGKAGKGPGTGRSSMHSDWSMTRHYYANNAILD